jgi:hypothetical protein
MFFVTAPMMHNTDPIMIIDLSCKTHHCQEWTDFAVKIGYASKGIILNGTFVAIVTVSN